MHSNCQNFVSHRPCSTCFSHQTMIFNSLFLDKNRTRLAVVLLQEWTSIIAPKIFFFVNRSKLYVYVKLTCWEFFANVVSYLNQKNYKYIWFLVSTIHLWKKDFLKIRVDYQNYTWLLELVLKDCFLFFG